ncbi:MAG: CFI-box-CTERM domain-containing protein, partial [Syntrophales bacterium]
YVFSVTAYDAAGSESENSYLVHWRSPQSGIQADDMQALKRFRDRYLATNRIGQFIIKVYGLISPPLVDLYQRSENFRMMAQWILAPLAFILKHLVGFVALVTITTFAGIGIMVNRRRKRKVFHSINMNPGRTLQGSV